MDFGTYGGSTENLCEGNLTPMTKRELIDRCLSLPHTYEDYPFNDVTDAGAWAIMRHQTNKKGFAHIYERNGKLCINLKCDPFEAEFLRRIYTDLTPAYHMNKRHWNTITLGGDVPEDELFQMIERSYELTKKNVRAGSDDEDV